MIFTKIGRTSQGAFFEQHPKFDIVLFDISNGAKRIEFHKGGNTKPIVVKEF
jgi:hypothetical protein